MSEMLLRPLFMGIRDGSSVGLKCLEICTAVQINFDCGTPIVAPQSK